jgi:putative Holliday junction resolvase
MRVIALDYGRARTGVAISDPTGTLARPLTVVERVRTPAGMDELVRLIDDAEAELVVVGLPLTLAGETGAQASETLEFVRELRERCGAPIETEDERFTTSLARTTVSPGQPDDAVAAAHLLEGYPRRLGG